MAKLLWYRRPDAGVINPRTNKAYPSNYAVPRIAYRAQHAHTYTESLVWGFLDGTARLIDPQKGTAGRKIRRVSMATIARELKMPESTVRDCLRSLVRKHSIVQWNLETGKPQRRVRGDFGGVTVWMIPPYTEVLETRRKDPAIGKVNDHCYVIGKGKRFLTPDEIVLWKVDAIVAARVGLKAAALGTPENELSADPDPPAEEPGAADTASGSSPPGAADPIPDNIWNAFLETVRNKNFSRKAARALVARVRRIAAKRNEQLSDEDIESAIRQAHQNANRNVQTFGFFEKSLPEKIEALIEGRERQRTEEAALALKCPKCLGSGKHHLFPMDESCVVCHGSGENPALKRAVNA